MTEQEMTLEQAIGCFRLVQNFEEYKEGLREMLTKCHTTEELEYVKAVIEEEKTRLLETDDEFKMILDRRKLEAKMRSDESRAIHRAKMSESKAEASKAKSQVMSDPDIEEWVAKTRVKTVDPEELEKNVAQVLWCPICRKRDNHNNTINGVLVCMICHHRLVSKSDLKEYNRKYRRRYLKSRKRG